MSLDRSLKGASGLTGHRNVLTRPERILRLTDKGLFKSDTSDPTHLPKVANRKAGGGKVKKEAAAEGTAAAAAAPAKGAAPAKAAAPAKGAAPAKAAAPAAKKK